MEVKIANLSTQMTFQGMHALIAEKRVAVAKNGKYYADLTVKDSSGSLKCKIWDYSEVPYLEVGKAVVISGETSEYNGVLQATLSQHGPSEKPVEYFGKKSRFAEETMIADVFDIISKFKEPLTKHVTETIVNKCVAGFKKAPAARGVHNAWYGGLLEHVWSMCSMAPSIISNYQNKYQCPISQDKIFFGLILHDIGKIAEYDWRNPTFTHRAEGVLANHIVMGPAIVYEECNAYWRTKPDMLLETFTKERAHLMHIMASHHGKLEWGSPVVPSTLEAIIVHQLDLLDSRVMHALELVEGKEGQIEGFSEKSWSEKTSYMQYNSGT